MQRTMQAGCLASLMAILFPLVLVLAAGLVVASMVGVLPDGVDRYVLGVERFAAARVIDFELTDQLMTVRSLDALPVKGGLAVTLAIDSKVELPADPPRPLALTALRVVAHQMGEPVGIGDSVTSIRLQIWGPTWKTPALDVLIKRADLESWRDGGLTDAEFEKTWKKP